jgi:hypothetical protein
VRKLLRLRTFPWIYALLYALALALAQAIVTAVLPGHTTTIGERVKAKTAAPSTSNGFIVGFTERGPTNRAVLCRSLTHFVEQMGQRTGVALTVYDAVDVAFREGASVVYVGREVGPAPVLATKTVAAAVGNSFRADASSVGDWANAIDIAVAASGGNFTVTVRYSGTVIATSPTLADVPALIAWASQNVSDFVTITDLGGGDPTTVAAQALVGGTDDHLNATDTQRLNALNLFGKDLGPGQVAAPGQITSTAAAQLVAHATANNRRALIDAADNASAAGVVSAVTALRGQPNNGDRYAAVFGPSVKVPGIAIGTTRTVAASAFVMGKIAKAESEGNPANAAAAGKRGRADYATDVAVAGYSDADRDLLNEASFNVIRVINGVPTIYGNRTLISPLVNEDWKSFSGSRQVMAVAAAADEVMADYDFEQIDGKGTIFSKLQGDLSGRACMPFFRAEALYGDTPEDAFTVNTGPDVNTPTTISNEEIHAQIGIRVSPVGELLTVEIVKVPVSEEL